MHYQAAVHVECLARDVARTRASQKRCHFGYVFRLVCSTNGDYSVSLLFQLIQRDAEVLGALNCRIPGHLRKGPARADGVHVDVISSKLMGRYLGHGEHRPLAGGVGRVGSARITLARD